MKRETPITVEWLEAHGFERVTGMQPVGYGERYFLKLTKNESIFIEISTKADSYGNYPLHMTIHNKNEVCDFYRSIAELSKKQCDYEKMELNCFYVEELLTLLDLTNNGELKEFFQ